jgi:hypothetical protein
MFGNTWDLLTTLAQPVLLGLQALLMDLQKCVSENCIVIVVVKRWIGVNMEHTIAELKKSLNNVFCFMINHHQDIEGYSEIIEILDKATPKKPFINGPSCRVCSNCDNYVAKKYTQNGVYKTGTTELYEFEIKFCPECGQALDWSEDE